MLPLLSLLLLLCSTAALASPLMDIEEGGWDDQKRKRDDAVGHGMKEDELGRPRFGLERQSTRT